MENINILHVALFLVGALYLGGMPYLAYRYANINPVGENWAPTPVHEPLIVSSEMEKLINLNTKLEKTEAITEKALLAIAAHFPYDLTTKTKEGHPVLYIRMDRWKTPEEVKVNELTFHKYLDKMLADAFSETIPLSVASGGSSIFLVLVNMDANYVDQEHYDKFFSVALRLFTLLLKRYRAQLGKLIYVNARQEFLDVHKRFESSRPPDIDMMEVLGEGEEAWGPFLLQYIAREALPQDLLWPELDFWGDSQNM